MPHVILITGIMAAGKSTVAQTVAERLQRSVHVREEMIDPPSPEATRQLRLRYELGTTVVRRYHEAGFDVVYQDVILGDHLTFVTDLLRDLPLSVVVLCPSPVVVAGREARRGKTGYGDWTVTELDASLREKTPRIGFWLDTSDLTVDETVDRILAHLDASDAPTGSERQR